MIQIQRILCPIDFSDCSRRALEHAIVLAKWYDARLTLFHACAPVPISAYAAVGAMMPSTLVGGEDPNEVRQAMQQFASLGTAMPTGAEIALGEGDAATEILAKADAERSDLIVLGTHGRSGLERLLLGSVTENVLRKARCPVLTVPPRLAGAAAAPTVTFRRVVCGVDFSECSMRALEYAMSMAQEANAQLTVLHVIEPIPTIPADASIYAGATSVREYIAAAEEEGRERLRRAIPESVRGFCQLETAQSVGEPYREILRIATEQAADLIVLGVHGRGAVNLMVFGSTTQHVVREAACPVLTLRT